MDCISFCLSWPFSLVSWSYS
ncbi:hypothetical protein BN873_530002 [Candidatus Competibacter denitrificans Run_A_D11]|uniref:Uncharacterized protein n=1 Tax=Candidatus Competibacter denitrificans Run_A_D11 TaxID=1400863 RepID=W6MDV3_9GAMM|nr:hypothetical protein BN873_530002 [Candidatus Competibacter denitrificans Run_A_D11]